MIPKEQRWFEPLMRWLTFKQRMGTMAKIATCAVVMGLAACGNNDDLNDERLGDIKVIVKENLDGQPYSDLNSVKVGDFIRYDLEVTGSGDAEKYDYKFNSYSSGNIPHQLLGKDYEAWLFTDVNYKAYKDKNTAPVQRKKIMQESKLKEGEILIQPNTKYVLLIRPLVPGTFKLDSHCSKYKKGESNSVIGDVPINFNCTKLEAWWVEIEDQSGGLFQESRSHNAFYFQVNDGTAETDKFLAEKENKKMTFEIIYDGNTYTGDFVEGKPIWFHNSEQGRGAPPVDNKIISYVRLSIAETGQKPINIEYHNIHMNKRN
jgi:hypothetical protein